MADNEKRLNEAELDQVSGGWDEEEEKRKKERSLHGRIVRDILGNVTFTDKTGVTGTFTADEWNKLRSQWAYTGNAEGVITQVPLSDLKALVEEHNKGNI